VLLRLSGHRLRDTESPEQVDITLTQDDLAGAANLSRSSVRTMLQRLAARGLIEQTYRGIVVRAPAALRDFAEQMDATSSD
jgi:DNA-binding GntR family transcriptional regulator